MSYPLTSAVSAGDATLASHYNNLRKDALYLGQDAADAVALGAALERLEFRLTLERLNTTQVRVPASASAPVSLLVDGFLVQSIANVDLDLGDAPSGAAAAYYVFANRAAASTSFTLSISPSITELDDQRRIGRFYWDGVKIVKDSVRTELAGHITDILYLVDPQVCHGRLTLSTGIPVPTSDIASSGFVYLTPDRGNRIALYVNDYGWRIYPFGELNLDLSVYGADKNLDVFIHDNAGTLTLSAVEWSNDTLRATAIVRQDGVWVKSGAPEYRYLGTVRTSAAGAACDTKLKRFVWNMYNRTEREMIVTEDTDSWTYTVNNTWRPFNNDEDNKVEFVIGVNESLVNFECFCLAENSGNNSIGVSVALDRTNDTDRVLSKGSRLMSVNLDYYGAVYKGLPGIGYHYLAIVELSGGTTTTYYGDKGCSNGEILAGGIGTILM
jgi:hypothetical protein